MAKLAILVIILLALNNTSSQIFDINETLKNLPEEAKLNFTQLSTKYATTAESHTVITVDGYVLTLFHIPGDKTRPVLLMHGIIGTADFFLDRGNTSLIACLYREGYDIWALNVRGTRYSRKHLHLDPNKDKKFWDFSIDELGNYDLPANIDYILNATRQEKLSLIGFSQGTTITFILGTSQPQYNKKIKIFIALAPVASLNNIGPVISFIAKNYLEINELFKILNIEEFFGYNTLLKALYSVFCSQSFGYDICFRLVLSSLAGNDDDQIEPEFFKSLLERFPDGTSKKNLLHYAQIFNRRRFSQFDYGCRNKAIYNSSHPPDYNLKKFIIDTVLISAKNDEISTLKDLYLLTKKLSNVTVEILKPDKFNHLDHIWGRDTHLFEYPLILTVLDKHNRNIDGAYV